MPVARQPNSPFDSWGRTRSPTHLCLAHPVLVLFVHFPATYSICQSRHAMPTPHPPWPDSAVSTHSTPHAHATFFFFPFSFRSDSQIEMSSFMPNISGRGICRGTVPPAYQVPPSGWESSRRGRRGGGLKPSKKGKMEKEEIANQFLFSESSLSFFLSFFPPFFLSQFAVRFTIGGYAASRLQGETSVRL